MLLLLLVVELLQVWPWCALLEKMLPYVTAARESMLVGSTDFCRVERYRLPSLSSSAWLALAVDALFVVVVVRAIFLFFILFLRKGQLLVKLGPYHAEPHEAEATPKADNVRTETPYPYLPPQG